jgi:hypothetical protein
MCALCGALGIADHWTDGSSSSPTGVTSRAELQHRIDIANRMLAPRGLKVSEWCGRYVLKGRAGGAAIVENIGALWPAAERLAGRPWDPLDPDLLARLEAGI